MSDAELLTRQGWPRPRYDGWPVPWVSPQGQLAVMDVGRQEACATGAICAVCGGDYASSDTAWALVVVDPDVVVNIDPRDQILPMDNAVMHERCYRLATARCPALLAKIAAGELVAVEVVAGEGKVELVHDEGGRARGVWSGEHVLRHHRIGPSADGDA